MMYLTIMIVLSVFNPGSCSKCPLIRTKGQGGVRGDRETDDAGAARAIAKQNKENLRSTGWKQGCLSFSDPLFTSVLQDRVTH